LNLNQRFKCLEDVIEDSEFQVFDYANYPLVDELQPVRRGDWVQLQQGTVATKIKKGVKYYLVVLKKSVRNLAEMGCELQLQSMFLCFLTFLKMRRPP
jgi:hypothetical protein